MSTQHGDSDNRPNGKEQYKEVNISGVVGCLPKARPSRLVWLVFFMFNLSTFITFLWDEIFLQHLLILCFNLELKFVLREISNFVTLVNFSFYVPYIFQ